MNENRLSFNGLQQVRIKSFDHPGGHGAADVKIIGGYRFAGF